MRDFENFQSPGSVAGPGPSTLPINTAASPSSTSQVTSTSQTTSTSQATVTSQATSTSQTTSTSQQTSTNQGTNQGTSTNRGALGSFVNLANTCYGIAVVQALTNINLQAKRPAQVGACDGVRVGVCECLECLHV